MRQAFIEAGQIVTTHGVRGEVKLLPWTDGPELLKPLRRCRVEGRTYEITANRVQKGCNLLKLAGVDTLEAAQALVGKTLEAYRTDFPQGLIFASELIGVEVFGDGAYLGKITDVLDYPGNKVYVVEGERKYLIPAVREFILCTDLDGNRMEIKLIEGMGMDAD